MRERPRFYRIQLIVLLALLGLALIPAEAKEKKPKTLDLTDAVLANRIMTKFAQLLRASDLGSFLSSRGPFTLFAPTDSAFSRVPPAAMDALLLPENKDTLQRIILFHVVNGKLVTAKDLLTLKTLLSCEGNPLPVRVSHTGSEMVQKSKILRADIRCLNGLMHQIDRVLLPPGVSFEALAAAPTAPPPMTNAPAVNVGPEMPPAGPTNVAPPADLTNAAPASP